jgi:hypothetical protein
MIPTDRSTVLADDVGNALPHDAAVLNIVKRREHHGFK